MANSPAPLDISILVPFLNEAPNLEECHARISRAMGKLALSYEILFIDDGSKDGGAELVERIARQDPRAKLIQFYRNYGQTAAMSAGIKYASGRVIIPMDADNQNNPEDIPHLLEKMKEGFGVVSGWREARKDHFLTRILPSRLANFLISAVTGVKLRDYGCTLKAYKAEYVKPIRLYGEMHRFIPAYSALMGASVAEVAVSHHPRTKGVSKYGLSRIFKVVLDLFTIKFLGAFATKPIYLFGSVGFSFLASSGLLGAWVLWDKYEHHVFAHRNPLLLLAVLTFIMGMLFVMIGLLAELLIRIYYESQNKDVFAIAKAVNLDMDPPQGRP